MKLITHLFLFFFISFSSSWAALNDDDEPLMPQEAFKLSAYSLNPETIRVEWKIEEGYYLYKHRFKFATDSKGIKLGEPVYPKGKIKEDEFFGKVESYRKKVSIDIPIERAKESDQDLLLKTTSQGCADIGICYPPQKEDIKFTLIPQDESSLVRAKDGGLATLSSISKQMGFGEQEEFLPVEKAFSFSAEAIDGNLIQLRWDIADGYYLYKDKFEFTIDQGEGVTLQKAIYPKNIKEKTDEAFGKMQVYYKDAVIKIPLNRSNLQAMEMVVRAKFQGCADAGFCYPPESTTMVIALPAGTAEKAEISSSNQFSSPQVLSEQDSIADSLANDSVIMIVLTFFGFGLLLALTPCVFPMIPILSSIIVGQGEELTTRKALIMSIVYVLAMALTYTVAGVLAGLFGANLQAAFQNPWVLSVFSIVFLLLSLSMFGFYELQLPAFLQSKLTEISNKQQGGTLAGVAIMGFLSALIVGPCVAAPLMGALIYIGQTGDAVLGGVALFALSLGMGAPLIAIGASAGKFLPKAGAWMDSIKSIFGVMLIAVAIWMLERILPAALSMTLWAVLLIVSGVFMGALLQLDASASGWKKLWKGLGVVLVIYGGLLLVGAASNSKDPLQPLRGISNFGGGGAGVAAVHEVEFKKIKSVEDLAREVKAANAMNKPVMLDFYADWCVSCKEMERYTFSQPGVIAEMSKGILLQADVTANDDIDKALLKKFRLIGPPSMIFYDRQGNEMRNMRLVGFLEADEFQAHVSKAFQ